jgi:hypothetical protein
MFKDDNLNKFMVKDFTKDSHLRGVLLTEVCSFLRKMTGKRFFFGDFLD